MQFAVKPAENKAHESECRYARTEEYRDGLKVKRERRREHSRKGIIAHQSGFRNGIESRRHLAFIDI